MQYMCNISIVLMKFDEASVLMPVEGDNHSTLPFQHDESSMCDTDQSKSNASANLLSLIHSAA
jgi:hypothetical protein